MFKETGQLSQSVDLLVLGLPVSGFLSNRRCRQELGGAGALQTARALWKRFCGRGCQEGHGLAAANGRLMLASNHQKNFDLFDEGVVSLVLDPGYNPFDWFVADGMARSWSFANRFRAASPKFCKPSAPKLALTTALAP